MFRRPAVLALAVLTTALVWSPSVVIASSGNAHDRPAGARTGVKFPLLGWYHSGGRFHAEQMDRYSRLGMRLIVAYHQSLADASRLLATSRKDGLSVMLEPDPSWMHSNDWAGLRQAVRALRSKHALYAWYLADEPDLNGISPSRLAKAYRIVKSLDHRHPVAVVFMSGSCRFGAGLDKRYLRDFDLLMFDNYPFYTFMRSNQASEAGVQEFAAATRHCVAAARQYHKLGPFMVLQGFGNGMKDGRFTWRDPTYQEESSMFRYALHAGARGLLFFADGYADRIVSRNVGRIVRRWYLPAARPQPTPVSRGFTGWPRRTSW